MVRNLLFTIVMLTSFTDVFSQTGKKFFQVSGQISRPTSSMLEVTKVGYGGAIKGMYGFGQNKQQATIEFGYDRFPVAGLPDGVEAHYSAFPIYIGYRYLTKKWTWEAQGGISINRIVGRNSLISVVSTRLNLGLGIGLGYLIRNFEVGARYQVTDAKGTEDDPSFLGLRLGYNFSL